MRFGLGGYPSQLETIPASPPSCFYGSDSISLGLPRLDDPLVSPSLAPGRRSLDSACSPGGGATAATAAYRLAGRRLPIFQHLQADTSLGTEEEGGGGQKQQQELVRGASLSSTSSGALGSGQFGRGMAAVQAELQLSPISKLEQQDGGGGGTGRVPHMTPRLEAHREMLATAAASGGGGGGGGVLQ